MFSLTGLDANSTYLMYINKIADRIFPKIFEILKQSFCYSMRRKADERTKLSFISAQWKKTVVIITFGKCLPCRPIPGIGAIFLIDLSGISKWSIPPHSIFLMKRELFAVN